MRVSVWCGRSQLNDPNKWLDLVQDSGCERVDLAVNDLSAWRVNTRGKITSRGIPQRSPWKTYDAEKLARFASLAVTRGLDVHTLFWVVPTPEAIEAGTKWLNDFQRETGCVGHVLDCEEPITKSSFIAYDNDADRAADHLAELIRGQIGVTHIGYAPTHIVRPFVERSAYALPQTYITKTSGLNAESVARICDRTRIRLGARNLVGGFALYRQPTPDAIQTTLQALQRQGIETAVGWHANGLKRYGKALKSAIGAINDGNS